MLVTQQKVLRRFWYPVIPADRLTDAPVPFTLLGTKLVLFRDAAGKASALIDRCCHRTARLSQGWLDSGNIVCPYHGWTYAGDGRCVRIPQRPGGDPGKGIAVDSFRCSERHGVVWVALEEPLRDIPDLPEYDDPAYRRVFEFYEPWQAPGLRIMENSFDNAHFAFVHKASFGIVDEPEPVQPRLEPHPAGFVMYADVPVKNPDIQKANLGIASDRTIRQYEKTWWMPFSRKMKVTYPNGLVHIIMTLTAPIDDRQSQVIQFLLRSDSEADAPAEEPDQVRPPGDARGHEHPGRLRRRRAVVDEWRNAYADRPAWPGNASHAGEAAGRAQSGGGAAGRAGLAAAGVSRQ